MLEALAADIVVFDAPEVAMAAKVVCNAVSHTTLVTLMEAAALALHSGISIESFIALMEPSDGPLMRPLDYRVRERVTVGDYEGGMPTEIAKKDSALALELARRSALPSFVIQAAHTVYEIGLHEGLGRLDYAALATLWEHWGAASRSHQLKEPPRRRGGVHEQHDRHRRTRRDGRPDCGGAIA